jgi:hypothetical protein
MKLTTSVWPAPPSASVWDRMTRPTVCCPTTTRAPARAAQRRPAARRRLVALEGTAVTLGRWFVPGELMNCPPEWEGKRFAYTVTAFDRQLARLAAGRSSFCLNIGHDGPALMESKENSHWSLWKAGDQLRFRLEGNDLGSRVILRAIQAQADRCFSLGTLFLDLHETKAGIIVSRARIYEISIVPRGACPGATFTMRFRKRSSR